VRQLFTVKETAYIEQYTKNCYVHNTCST